MPGDWERLELVPPEDDEPLVLVDGQPREPDEAERRARRRDDKWQRKGYRR